MTNSNVETKMVSIKPKVGETWINSFTNENVVIHSVRNTSPLNVTNIREDKSSDIRSSERFNQIFRKVQPDTIK